MLALRILISAALIAFLVYSLDMRAVGAAVLAFSPWTVLLGLLLMAVAHVVNTWRWQRLLPAVRLLRLLQLNMVAVYYTIVLPGVVAGELVKAYRAGKESHDPDQAYASILMDKLIGLLAVAILGLLAGALSASFTGAWLQAPLIGLGIIFLAVVALPFAGRVIDRAADMWHTRPHWTDRLIEVLHEVVQAIRRYWRDRPKMVLVTGVGVLAQCTMAAMIYVLLRDHYPEVDFFDICFVFSVVALLMILPLSVAGIGVREAGMVAMLPQLGVSPEDALAVSLVSFFINACYAVIGAIVDFRDGMRVSAVAGKPEGRQSGD